MWRGEMKMVLTLPPFQGVMSAALGKLKKELSKCWKQEWNSRNSGEEKRSEEGENSVWGEWAGTQIGQEQGESGSCALYRSFICFWGCGTVGCVWWKSFTASLALVSFEVMIHLFSSKGNPFQATRYSMFPWHSQEARISSISCFSTPWMRSWGGGGAFFWEGKEGGE